MSTENYSKDDHEKIIVKDGKTYRYNEISHRCVQIISFDELLAQSGFSNEEFMMKFLEKDK